MPGDHISDALTLRLLYLIGSGRIIGLIHLLWCAHEMLCHNWLSDDNVDLLSDRLPELYDEFEYENIDSQKAVIASLVRQYCAKIANHILKTKSDERLTDVVSKAAIDPLPEVRRFKEIETL